LDAAPGAQTGSCAADFAGWAGADFAGWAGADFAGWAGADFAGWAGADFAGWAAAGVLTAKVEARLARAHQSAADRDDM
jgi:hypothetical protein